MAENYEIKKREGGFYTKFKHNNHNYVADLILIKLFNYTDSDSENIIPLKNA